MGFLGKFGGLILFEYEVYYDWNWVIDFVFVWIMWFGCLCGDECGFFGDVILFNDLFVGKVGGFYGEVLKELGDVGLWVFGSDG